MSKWRYEAHCKRKEKHLQEAFEMYGSGRVELPYMKRLVNALYKESKTCEHITTFEIRDNIRCSKCYKIIN